MVFNGAAYYGLPTSDQASSSPYNANDGTAGTAAKRDGRASGMTTQTQSSRGIINRPATGSVAAPKSHNLRYTAPGLPQNPYAGPHHHHQHVQPPIQPQQPYPPTSLPQQQPVIPSSNTAAAAYPSASFLQPNIQQQQQQQPIHRLPYQSKPQINNPPSTVPPPKPNLPTLPSSLPQRPAPHGLPPRPQTSHGPAASATPHQTWTSGAAPSGPAPAAASVNRPVVHPLPSRVTATRTLPLMKSQQSPSASSLPPPPIPSPLNTESSSVTADKPKESVPVSFPASRKPLPSQAEAISASASSGTNSTQCSHCDVCNITVPSPVHLVAHQRNQHIKCCKAAEGCKFEAMPSIVEIHEQDRHLVFKPGARPERTKPDGPLNARIQGTNVKLETEEDIAKWIAERKRKWPSARNMELKEERDAKRRAYEEASPANFHHSNHDSSTRGGRGRGRDRGRGRGALSDTRARGGHRLVQNGRTTDPGSEPVKTTAQANRHPQEHEGDAQVDVMSIAAEAETPSAPQTADTGRVVDDVSSDEDSVEDEEAAWIAARLVKTGGEGPTQSTDIPTVEDVQDSHNESDSDGEPEEVSNKLSAERCEGLVEEQDEEDRNEKAEAHPGQEDAEPAREDKADRPDRSVYQQRRDCSNWIQTGKCRFGENCRYRHDPAKKHAERPQPPPPPKNPFVRDDLIGKLLHNEIRHEVSDLVQVIDFLARNQWLENVELYAGQKEEIEGRIRVINPQGEMAMETAQARIPESVE